MRAMRTIVVIACTAALLAPVRADDGSEIHDTVWVWIESKSAIWGYAVTGNILDLFMHTKPWLPATASSDRSGIM
jgi:hypothetical protein